MSPGPDLALVIKNCLGGNFRSGFVTAAGIASALLIHVSYCMFGVALVISESPTLFLIIKFLGAAYLFYLGISLLRDSSRVSLDSGQKGPIAERYRSLYFSGLLCNLLNPKATLFVLSLFTQLLDPATSLAGKAYMGLVIGLVTLGWFAFISHFLTYKKFRSLFFTLQPFISKFLGLCLCFLALSILVSSGMNS